MIKITEDQAFDRVYLIRPTGKYSARLAVPGCLAGKRIVLMEVRDNSTTRRKFLQDLCKVCKGYGFYQDNLKIWHNCPRCNSVKRTRVVKGQKKKLR